MCAKLVFPSFSSFIFFHFIHFTASAIILLQIFHNFLVTTCLNREGLLYIRHSSLDMDHPDSKYCRWGIGWNVKKYQNKNIFKLLF